MHRPYRNQPNKRKLCPRFSLLLGTLCALLLLLLTLQSCDTQGTGDGPDSAEGGESITEDGDEISIPTDSGTEEPAPSDTAPDKAESTADGVTLPHPTDTDEAPPAIDPEVTTAKDPETTVKPSTTTAKEPETTVKEPETTVKEPETTVKDPETTVKDPETTVKDPETTVKDPVLTGPEPADHIAPRGTLKLTMTEIFKISDHTDGNNVHCRVVQGGCSDGTYYYVGLNNGVKTSASVTAFLKYEIATGELVAVYEDLRVAHCNDMEYLPDTNEILVVHNEPERWLVSVFDADTMERKRTVTLGDGATEIYSLTYDPYEQCYWAGLSYGFNFIKLDLNFEQIGEIYIGKVTGYTKQGMTCDSRYLYFLQYKTNAIIVYDKSGAFVREIPLPKTSYEPENIFYIGDTFYIGYYKSRAGGMLYKTTLEKITDYDTTVTVEESPYTTLPQFTGTDGSFYKVAQGSCSDGTYLYVTLNDDNKDNVPGYRSALHKIDLRTGEVVQIMEGLETGSTNDMTYNPKTGEIVIATDNPDKYKLVILDAETLTVKRTVTLTTKVFAIAYDEARNGYWLALSGGYDFIFVDADFKKVGSTYTGYSTGYTKQAIDYDGEYLYFLQSKQNAVAIYKQDGTFVGVAALPPLTVTLADGTSVSVTSAQSICHVGDTFYIGFYVENVGCVLYECEITVED